MDQRYEPVRFLCQDSATRAQGFRQLLLAAALEEQAQRQRRRGPGAAVSPAEGGGAAAAAAGGSDDDGGVEKEKEEEEDEEEEEEEEEVDESLLRAALLQVRGHMFKRLAELATAQLQLLLDHGVNLAAPARCVLSLSLSLFCRARSLSRGDMGRRSESAVPWQAAERSGACVVVAVRACRTKDIPVGSSIAWPERALAQARLLQRQARLMARDVEAVAGLYSSALQATLDQQHAEEASASHEAAPASPAGAGVAAAAAAAAAAPGAAAEGARAGAEQGAGIEVAQPGVGHVAEEDVELCRQALQQLRSARGVASGALEEAFRGLLYPVLVRELVQRIAGGPGEEEGEGAGEREEQQGE